MLASGIWLGVYLATQSGEDEFVASGPSEPAPDEDEWLTSATVFGTLQVEGDGVADVQIQVLDGDGELTSETRTGDSGAWEISGRLPREAVVVLGLESLPADVAARDSAQQEQAVRLEEGIREEIEFLLDYTGETTDDPAFAWEGGPIRMGVANEVPFGYVEAGQPTGIGPSVALAVLERLGISDVEVEVLEFGDLVPALQAGRIDIISAGMFLTPERAQQIAFSQPDYCLSSQLAVAPGNPHGLTDLASVAASNAHLGVISGSLDEDYAADAGVPGSRVHSFATMDELFNAVRTGHIDAALATSFTVQEQVDFGGALEATEPFFTVHVDSAGNELLGCGAHGFADQDLRDAFDEALAELQAEGEVVRLLGRFGFPSADARKAEEVTRDDLSHY